MNTLCVCVCVNREFIEKGCDGETNFISESSLWLVGIFHKANTQTKTK